MLYAKVVFGLSIEGPFDYIVPQQFQGRIFPGSRVRVQFRTQNKIGYVVATAKESHIKFLKPLLEVIDKTPVLDRFMLSLTKELSDYYCCSWGEVIETALPEGLRKGRILPEVSPGKSITTKGIYEPILVHAIENREKWRIYIEQTKKSLDNNKTVIFLLADIISVSKAREIIKERLSYSAEILYRKQPSELEAWSRVKQGEARVVIGTRSAIFAPLSNLGLIIVDQEEDSVYKQDQVPHYNARIVAFMRAKKEKTKLIFGSSQPSLESLFETRKNRMSYLPVTRIKPFPQIKIVDTSGLLAKTILSKYLADAIFSNLTAKGKTLLFLNRKGFATVASCRHCGFVLKCVRCNVNLVYHFKEDLLSCHYCNYKLKPPKICPNCNSDYIRYSGAGTEKIESELSRIFPQARILRLDDLKQIDINSADIFISAQAIIKETELSFDLVGVLSIDNTLNRIDFRSAEKAFGLLIVLSGLAAKEMVIQTRLPGHHCFKALLDKKTEIFYDQELKERKQLGFPPFKHLAIVKLRGYKEELVKKKSQELFVELKKINKSKDLGVICVNPGQPSKLRGNYYWNILLKAKSAPVISKFLKKNLKVFSHSGIIVTVDVDPV